MTHRCGPSASKNDEQRDGVMVNGDGFILDGDIGQTGSGHHGTGLHAPSGGATDAAIQSDSADHRWAANGSEVLRGKCASWRVDDNKGRKVRQVVECEERFAAWRVGKRTP